MAKKKTLVNVHPNGELPKLQNVGKLPRGQFKLDQPRFREGTPSISLKYIDMKFKSFNDLKDNNKLKEWDGFLRKFGDAPNWDYVFRTWKKDQTGSEKAKSMMKTLGMDPNQMEMFHIRVTDEFRIHGFKIGDRFKLIWLDPYHEIDKM